MPHSFHFQDAVRRGGRFLFQLREVVMKFGKLWMLLLACLPACLLLGVVDGCGAGGRADDTGSDSGDEGDYP